MKPLHAHAALMAAVLWCSSPAIAQTLTGWAQMPAATFADGPTSGQFARPNPYGANLPPFAGRQPVQGFSGVLHGPRPNTYRFVVDNGFGAKGNSADALLRAYTVRIDWRTRADGSDTVSPVDESSGRRRDAFDATTRMSLIDAQRLLTLPIQADYTHYYNNPTNPLVDPEIRSRRLLTGADFDIESFRRDAQGHYWFGDEFGPYLIKTDATGTVLRSQIA